MRRPYGLDSLLSEQQSIGCVLNTHTLFSHSWVWAGTVQGLSDKVSTSVDNWVQFEGT